MSNLAARVSVRQVGESGWLNKCEWFAQPDNVGVECSGKVTVELYFRGILN